MHIKSDRYFSISRVACCLLSVILIIIDLVLVAVHEAVIRGYRSVITELDDIWIRRIVSLGAWKVIAIVVILTIISVLLVAVLISRNRQPGTSIFTLYGVISILSVVLFLLVICFIANKYFDMITLLTPRTAQMSYSGMVDNMRLLRSSLGGIIFTIPFLIYCILQCRYPQPTPSTN